MPLAPFPINDFALRPVLTPAGEHPHLVYLAWPAAQQSDCAVQVYLDGELAAVTTDPLQREVWLACDRGLPHRVELLAVPATANDERDAPWRPRPGLLAGPGDVPPETGGAEGGASFAGPLVALIRDEALPPDTQVEPVIDGEPRPTQPLWPGSEHRGGFGALFGEGEHGRDAATAPGLGHADLGAGRLGADGTPWRWRGRDLSPGLHTIALHAKDRAGRPVAQPLGFEIDVPPSPPAARAVRISEDFTLEWEA